MTAQTFYPSFGTTQSTFVGWVQDDRIYTSDMQGQRVVGVVTKVFDTLNADYDSVSARCKEYYDRLVALGDIKPELTGDALIKAQAEELEKATSLIAQMSKNQEHLLALIQNMNQQAVPEEECVYEHSAGACQDDSGAVSQVANADNGIVQAPGGIPKHKARFVKSNRRA